MKKMKPYEDLFSTYPLLNLVIPLMVGIVLGHYFPVGLLGQDWGFFLLALLSLCLCFFLYKLGSRLAIKDRLFSLFLYLGMGSLGAGLISTEEGRLQTDWPDNAEVYRMMLMDSPKEYPKSWQATAQICGGDYTGRKIRLSLMKPTAVPSAAMSAADTLAARGSDSLRLQPGDVLLVRTRIECPHNAGNPGEFDFAQWLLGKGISGVGFSYASQWTLSKNGVDESDLPLRVRALRWRENWMRQYEAFFQGKDLAVLSAMTLGDKRHLDAEVRDVFSQTGVSHVLALSGLHLSILFCVYRLLVLSLCRRRWLYVVMSFVGVAGLWLFVMLSGFPLSLVRAAIMFSILQGLSCLRHDSLGINNLAFAALVILIASPQALFDVGFQLSFLSVFAIMLFSKSIRAPRWMERCWPLKKGVELLLVSGVAQLATGPLVAYYFHIFPIYGLVANLVAVPLAYAIVALSSVFFFAPFLQPLLAPVMAWLLQGMESSLTTLSEWPGAVLYLYPSASTVGLVYLLLLSLLAYALHRKVVGLYLAGGLCLVMAGIEGYVHRPDRLPSQLIFYHRASVPVVHAIVSADHSYLWSPDSSKAEAVLRGIEKTFWKQEHLAPPVWLDSLSRESDIYCNGNLLAFDGRRVAMCCRRLQRGMPPQPMKVDYLLLGRGAHDDLTHILKYYMPVVIVLDGSLTDFYYKKYVSETAGVSCPVYDMRKQGALRVLKK